MGKTDYKNINVGITENSPNIYTHINRASKTVYPIFIDIYIFFISDRTIIYIYIFLPEIYLTKLYISKYLKFNYQQAVL